MSSSVIGAVSHLSTSYTFIVETAKGCIKTERGVPLILSGWLCSIMHAYFFIFRLEECSDSKICIFNNAWSDDKAFKLLPLVALQALGILIHRKCDRDASWCDRKILFYSVGYPLQIALHIGGVHQVAETVGLIRNSVFLYNSSPTKQLRQWLFSSIRRCIGPRIIRVVERNLHFLTRRLFPGAPERVRPVHQV